MQNLLLSHWFTLLPDCVLVMPWHAQLAKVLISRPLLSLHLFFVSSYTHISLSAWKVCVYFYQLCICMTQTLCFLRSGRLETLSPNLFWENCNSKIIVNPSSIQGRIHVFESWYTQALIFFWAFLSSKVRLIILSTRTVVMMIVLWFC